MDKSDTHKTDVHWETVCSFETTYHVDTIEFSPDHDIAICGSYELDEECGKRVGQLLVFKQTDHSLFDLSVQIDCAGILDLSWLDNVTAVGAQANGKAALWHFDENNPTSLTSANHQITEALLLSTQVTHEKIFFSDSAGCLHLWTAVQGSEPRQLISHKAHEFEVWCVTGDTLQGNVYYSGGDDGLCYAWDERCGSSPTLSFKHDVGVCSVVSQPIGSSTISTGCYDGFLRIWDLRMPRERACDHPRPTLFVCSSGGGGIWRHKWLLGRYVLMAAMHAGFAVVGPICPSQYNDDTKMLEPLAWYRPSAKLAYGIDCYDHQSSHLTDDKHLTAIVATCSFYDNSVNFSRIVLPSVPPE